MIPVHAARERNTRNAAGSTNRRESYVSAPFGQMQQLYEPLRRIPASGTIVGPVGIAGGGEIEIAFAA